MAPDWLVENISYVVLKESLPPAKPPISFDTDKNRLNRNSELLSSFSDYGSEFRPLDDMRSILGKHSNSTFFEKIYKNGMDYSFVRDLSEEERITEMESNLAISQRKPQVSHTSA